MKEKARARSSALARRPPRLPRLPHCKTARDQMQKCAKERDMVRRVRGLVLRGRDLTFFGCTSRGLGPRFRKRSS